MAKLLEYNATLVERIDLTSALAIFRVAPDHPAVGPEPWFVPGQYAVIGLNHDEQPELGSVRRSMSIASPPEDFSPVEFYIRFVAQPTSQTPLTHLLFGNTRPGDRIYLRPGPNGPGVAGKFTIADTVGVDDRRLKVLVAAGTGAAPFVCMARSELRRNPGADLSGLAILHGASYANELGYREELQGYHRDSGLHYFGTVSRPQGSPEWQGATGRVEDFFLPERLAELELQLGLGAGGFAPENVVVMVCGLQGTIGKSIERLVDRGFVADQRRVREALGVDPSVEASLFFEQYDAEPVIDLKNPEVIGPLRERMNRALAAR